MCQKEEKDQKNEQESQRARQKKLAEQESKQVRQQEEKMTGQQEKQKKTRRKEFKKSATQATKKQIDRTNTKRNKKKAEKLYNCCGFPKNCVVSLLSGGSKSEVAPIEAGVGWDVGASLLESLIYSEDGGKYGGEN